MPTIPGGTAPPITPTSTRTADTSGASPSTGPDAATGVSSTPPVANTPVDTLAPSGGSASGSTSRLGKVKHKLIERTWQEVTKEHSARIASLSLSDEGALGVRLLERVHLADSELVQGSPARMATTTKLAQESGKPVFWLESGGLMDADVGLTKSIPLAGMLNVHGGFSTSAALEYRALHPYPADGSDAAKQLFKDHTVNLPLDAERAKELRPGSRVQLTGRGSATLSAGIGVGASTSMGSVSGALGGSLDSSTTRSGVWSVDVTRLEGEKVRVLLTEVTERRRATAVSVDAGLTLDGDALVDKTLGGSLDTKSEGVALDGAFGDVAGANGGGLSALLKNGGAGALEKAVRKYTAFHASSGTSAVETRRDVTSYVLDLGQPEARKAYDELLKLDERSAASVAARADSGVSRHVYSEVETGTGRDAAVRFAGKKLLLFNALRAEREGTLRANGETQVIRTSRYESRYSGLITGAKDVKWEGVRVAKAGDARGESFFHLRFSKDDKITHNSEIRSFVRFADALGVKDADERKIVMPSSNWLTRLFSDDDNTRVRADVYFTDEGVAKMAATSHQDAVSAFVKVAGEIEPELAGLPVGDTNAVTLLRDYYVAEAKIEELGRFPSDRDANRSEIAWYEREQRKLASKYEDAGHPKRDMKKHALCLRSADQLASRLQAMGTAGGDDAGWPKVFADLGQAQRFDYMTTLATLARLAGEDATLVHDVSLEGAGVKLRAVDEGTLMHPDSLIADATTGHS